MLDIRIAKPCDQTWTAMKGDEQVRHCGACQKNVYNIAAMTETEVEALIRRTEGHFCARIYRRTDGRILTADCPRGVAAVRRKRTLAVTGVFAAFTGVLYAMPVMGTSRNHVRVQLGRLRAEPFEKPIGTTTGIVSRPIYRREEATMGKIVLPEKELGEVTVTIGAPMVKRTNPEPERAQPSSGGAGYEFANRAAPPAS